MTNVKPKGTELFLDKPSSHCQGLKQKTIYENRTMNRDCRRMLETTKAIFKSQVTKNKFSKVAASNFSET